MDKLDHRPAGLEKMNLGTFLLFTAIGTSIWNLALLGAGFYMGQNWESVVSFMDKYSLVFWIIMGILVVFFVFRRWHSLADK